MFTETGQVRSRRVQPVLRVASVAPPGIAQNPVVGSLPSSATNPPGQRPKAGPLDRIVGFGAVGDTPLWMLKPPRVSRTSGPSSGCSM